MQSAATYVSQEDQRALRHLRKEQVATELAAHNNHDELMEQTGQHEGEYGRHVASQTAVHDQFHVNVLQQEVVHGAVPLSRKLVHRAGIPPVLVEFAVGEAV